MSSIIIASSGGLYTVMTAEGEIKCRARGVFRHKNERPVVGDRVELCFADGETAVIESICERKNVLIRPSVANLDYIFVTVASSSPAPDTFMIDKLTTIAEYNNIRPVIIVGKCELDPAKAKEIADIYKLAGYDCFCLSCYTGEGTDALRGYIKGLPDESICAFAGASGVGKSSLMNILFPDLDLETGTVSAKTERGRHTTRSVTLYPAGNGFIADTPGFSMLDFEHFDFFGKDDLPGTFPEFADLLGHCRYTKCTHTKEDGCAIREAVTDGRIAPSRHRSYAELYSVLKNKHEWDK